jgi:hypothetical protein
MTDEIDTSHPERIGIRPCAPFQAPDDYYVVDPTLPHQTKTEYVRKDIHDALRERAERAEAAADAASRDLNAEVNDVGHWRQRAEKAETECAELRAIIARMDDAAPLVASTYGSPFILLSEAVRRERAALRQDEGEEAEATPRVRIVTEPRSEPMRFYTWKAFSPERPDVGPAYGRSEDEARENFQELLHQDEGGE